MIITKTPFRMSFFGGGTDFPEYYKEHGGSVLSTTFDKYCYVTVRHLPRFFEYSSQIVYSRIESVKAVDEIVHPAVREAMKYLDMHELRITYDADLPARSGLGTSSSFAVGMLNAFYALKGKYADKRRLADDAILLERELCKESGGVQDQIAASFGGFNRIHFGAGGYEVEPVIISPQKKALLNDNLMLFFTGFSRYSSDIQRCTQAAMRDKQKELAKLHALVGEATDILVSDEKDLSAFGELLDYTWRLKRGMVESISNEGIDALYKKAKDAGASGGKLLGAGGGGFLLFYVEKEYREAVRNALDGLMYVPFCFEEGGTRVIHYSPENYELPK